MRIKALAAGLLATGLACVIAAPFMAGEPDPCCKKECCQKSCCKTSCCDTGCHSCCNIEWLKCWKCEDLEMKPVEQKCKSCCSGCGWCHDLLWCPPEEEKKEEEKKEEANGEKKANGNGEKKNGNGEAAAEEEELTPLMAYIRCKHPDCYSHLKCNETKVYGWLQVGATFNPDGSNRGSDGSVPSSALGPQFNNRHNDSMLNQLWLRIENPLEHEKCCNFGYTIDFNFGQDAADFNVLSLGMWENFTGDADAAIADDEDYGLDIPQFFVEAHIPCFITEKGLDIRVGRFLTLHGNELSPAPQTRFYSHSYGYFYGWPLSHTGVMTVLHLTDTVDVYNGLVLGWDNVFSDNNDKLSYNGQILWTACDKRSSAFVTYTYGPEGIGRFQSNNSDERVLITADYSRKCGCYDEWELVLHGGYGHDEQNVFNGTSADATWTELAANVFYTIDPHLILGARVERFDDEDGYRTGFANEYYEATFGLTYKPYQNLRIRPEFRVDFADTNVFNDFEDDRMYTFAVDAIWEF